MVKMLGELDLLVRSSVGGGSFAIFSQRIFSFVEVSSFLLCSA